MPNLRPKEIPPDDRPQLIAPLVDDDEVLVSRPDGDWGVPLSKLKTYTGGSSGGGGSATDIGGIGVAISSPINRQVLRLNTDLDPDKWVNATIAADSPVLQVSATGSETPANPLAGNAFALPSQAIRWAKDNLRITTSLTLNIASSANPYQEPTGFTAGGDGYLTIFQGPAGGGAIINDRSDTPGNSGFLTVQGRVNLTNVTLTSKRWSLYSQRGCSTLITACTISNTDDNQVIQGTDMQIRFSGLCVVNGPVVLDASLSIASNATVTINTAKSPALTFRGNADCIWGSAARIGFGGTGRVVQIENVSGIRTDSAVWLGGPTFNYITVQPVRSDVAGLATAFAASKVLNAIVVAGLPGSDPQFPGTPVSNTLYLIP